MAINCIPCDQNFGSGKALQQHKRNSLAHAFDCTACDRHFGSGTALQQHLRNSPAHHPFFDCDDCDRSFESEKALEQHRQDSPAHVPSFDCDTCDRSFESENALEQHRRDSPAHAPSFDCYTCDRSFGSEGALEQHMRGSTAHFPSFDCAACDRSFDSEKALEQHIRDSPAHAPSLDCDTCDRSFGSEEALEQHLRTSRDRQQASKTPLDIFFLSFQNFKYDPSLPPATSYAYLRKQEGWQRGGIASNNAWNRYQDALESELRMWYGTEENLAAWHALCRAIDVKPLPQTCEQCEESVRRTHVNIVDLIEWGRRRENSEERVQTFRNVVELRAYTKETGKIFRNTFGQEDSNVVLRHLLRKIFRESL